jgi:hypothetical protein
VCKLYVWLLSLTLSVLCLSLILTQTSPKQQSLCTSFTPFTIFFCSISENTNNSFHSLLTVRNASFHPFYLFFNIFLAVFLQQSLPIIPALSCQPQTRERTNPFRSFFTLFNILRLYDHPVFHSKCNRSLQRLDYFVSLVYKWAHLISKQSFAIYFANIFYIIFAFTKSLDLDFKQKQDCLARIQNNLDFHATSVNEKINPSSKNVKKNFEKFSLHHWLF